MRRPQLPRRTGGRRRITRERVLEQARLLLARGREALGRLDRQEQLELGRLVVKSRGRWRYLTGREQQRLRELVTRALLRE